MSKPTIIISRHGLPRQGSGRGTITYDQIDISPPGTLRTKTGAALPYTKRDARNVIQRIPCTLGQIQRPAPAARRVPGPKISAYPIRMRLHNFQLQSFYLGSANEKSPYADAFPGAVSEEAVIVNDREVEVDFDFPNTMYTHALPSKNWISTGLYAPR